MKLDRILPNLPMQRLAGPPSGDGGYGLPGLCRIPGVSSDNRGSVGQVFMQQHFLASRCQSSAFHVDAVPAIVLVAFEVPRRLLRLNLAAGIRRSNQQPTCLVTDRHIGRPQDPAVIPHR